MRAGESRTVIKRMQEFMDNLDRHVLNQKVLGNIKVKHLAAAFLAYKALQGMGKVENAETTGQIYAGGLQAIASMGGAFGMIGEKHFDGPENSDRTALNTMIVSATHFMVAQAKTAKSCTIRTAAIRGRWSTVMTVTEKSLIPCRFIR